jgi:2OG-Fe(II) oxygenase superfamily
MLRITRTGTVVSGDLGDLDELRAAFEAQHCVQLRGLLDRELVQLIRDRVDDTQFYERPHDDIAREQCLADPAVQATLVFLVNDDVFFDAVRRITGCGQFKGFWGRIYRMLPNQAHFDSWHDDVDGDRVIGMSINLSAAEFRGGEFQIRERGSELPHHQIANTGLGDAVLFRIGENLEHRVASVEGTAAKVAFAGWFVSTYDKSRWGLEGDVRRDV